MVFAEAKTTVAAEPYNYADLWRSWNIVAREDMVLGFVYLLISKHCCTAEGECDIIKEIKPDTIATPR